MKYFVFILVFFTFSLKIALSQEMKFDELLKLVETKYFWTDLSKAEKITDSLINSTSSSEQEIGALLLGAKISRRNGDFFLAIQRTRIAERKAELSGYYELACKASWFLSESFLETGLIGEANRYLLRAKRNAELIREPSKMKSIQTHLLQEEARGLMAKSDYVAAIKLLESSAFQVKSNSSNFSLNVEQHINFQHLMGVCYLELGKLNLSGKYLYEALQHAGSLKDETKLAIYQAQAERLYKLGELDSCKYFLDKAYPYVEKVDPIRLKERLYWTFARYFASKADYINSNKYFEFFNQAVLERVDLAGQIADELIIEFNKEQLSIKKRNLILLWTLIAVVVSAVSYYIVKKQGSKVYLPLVEPDQGNSLRMDLVELDIPAKLHVKEHPVENDLNISLDTENRLVRDLNVLETDMFFLDKNITLTNLANKLQSNQKYVSYVIRKYRSQNFNDYVLNLRIHYLIDQLKENEIMLDYKLSYLADLAGFSSHSKFTMAFKSVVGMPPSQYMEDLRDLIMKKK